MLAVSVAPLVAGVAWAREAIDFSVSAQPLEAALYEFATEAGVSFAVPPEGLGDAVSHGVSGRQTLEDGMRELLAGTGFRSRQTGPGAYRIERDRRVERSQSDGGGAAETIVVTAARLPAPLNELPRSVTYLSGARLEDLDAHDVGDVLSSVSGLSRTNLGMGRDKLLLRGISDGALTGRAQSTVGIYLNGLRLTYAAPDPDLQLVDIRDVEVLRGPQGALYGAGSIGGIVQIETQPVDLDQYRASAFGAYESVSAGDPDSDLELMANIPVIAGRFGLRAVAYDQEVGGWLDNPVLGATNTNATRRRGGRLTATAQVSAAWQVSAFGVYQMIDSDDAQYTQVEDGNVRTANLLEPHDNDFLAMGASISGDLSWARVESTSAIVRHRLGSRYDATGAFASLGVDPALARPFDDDEALNIRIHETRFSSNDSAAAPWLLGFFYADGDNSRTDILRDGAYGVWDGVAYSEHRKDAVDEMAVFGEVTWRLAPSVNLTTGLRAFRSDVHTTSDTVESLLGLSETVSRSMQTTGFAPDVRLSYQPNQSTLLYFSAAQGFRGGGFNTGGPIGAPPSGTQPFARYAGDSLMAFELGTRLTLFEQRLHVDAAIFYHRWNNIQTDALVANGFPYTGNVGDGDAYGVEAELRYRVNDDLTIGVNALANEPELRDPEPSFPAAVAGGFPGSPEWSGGAFVRYERPLSMWATQARAYVEADAEFVGRSVLGFGAGASVGGYATGRLRLGLDAGAWDLSLYGENLGDAEAATFSAGNPYAPTATPFVTAPKPLTVGVSLRRRF